MLPAPNGENAHGLLRNRARIPLDFYQRSVLEVARACIGKILVHASEAGLVAGRIVETEAYRGPEDRAAHSRSGVASRRTQAMFGEGGHVYMFLVYGLHWHFNIVTGSIGQPHAVLVRAVEPLLGLELMSERRAQPLSAATLTNGPGKLCAAFGFDRSLYGESLSGDRAYLMEAPNCAIRRSPRIGIEYAGNWARKPWRFFEPNNRYVSRCRPARQL